MSKRKFEGFQFPGQIPIENINKIKAPKGKFIVVEKSENNITGWGFTIICIEPTKEKAFSKMRKNEKRLGNKAADCYEAYSRAPGNAYNSIVCLVVNSKGEFLNRERLLL